VKRRGSESFCRQRAASRRRERARIAAAVALARELAIELPDLYMLSHRERNTREKAKRSVWRAFKEIGLLPPQLRGNAR
jgi:hypothetical protein